MNTSRLLDGILLQDIQERRSSITVISHKADKKKRERKYDSVGLGEAGRDQREREREP